MHSNILFRNLALLARCLSTLSKTLNQPLKILYNIPPEKPFGGKPFPIPSEYALNNEMSMPVCEVYQKLPKDGPKVL